MKFVDERGEGTSPTLAALRAYREHRATGNLAIDGAKNLGFGEQWNGSTVSDRRQRGF